MKYFLDFEGTQFSHRIISIGAVCENGHSFYSLVKPESKYKISKMITELTGITIEDIDNAKGAIEVFNEFYNWVLPSVSSMKPIFLESRMVLLGFRRYPFCKRYIQRLRQRPVRKADFR